MAADTNSNEIRIRAKKISSINQLPDDYLNQDTADNSYMLVAYNDGENPGYNYKVAISKIMNQIEDNLIEDPRTHGKSAYEVYVDSMRALGQEPVSEEDWLRSLKGRNGIDGDKGDKGDKGDQGVPGADGKSAYEIAVEHGYTGTEEEWINSIGSNSESIEALRTELMNLINDYHATRTITCNLTNINENSGNTHAFVGKTPITLMFSPKTGYNMPEENMVTVSGASFTYSQSQKTILLYDYTSLSIIITMVTNDKIEYQFTTTSLDNNLLSVALTSENNTYSIDDTFEIQLTVNNEGYTYPDNINGVGCTVVSYDNQTGIATLKCKGTSQMSITGKAKDIKQYIFSYAIGTNPQAFTWDQHLEIIDIHWNYFETLPYTVHTTGTSVINYNTGITWDISMDVERANVYMLFPKKYYNISDDTFNDDNGNKWILTDIFGNKNDLLKTPQVFTYNNIEYILYLYSNNGATDTQTFGRI